MFDQVINRQGTYCTQWDYIQDRFGKADLLPFTISDTDFSVPTSIVEALEKRMKHPIFGYTRWNHEALKTAILNWYRQRFELEVNQEWFAYSPSVIYSVKKLLTIVTKPGQGVIVQTPVYDAFYKVIRGNDRVIIENELMYDEGKYSIDFDLLEEQMKERNNTALLLCSPHNPTGRVWTANELNRIVTLSKKYGVFIISDEIHMDILRKGVTHQPIVKYAMENVAVVTSGSKTFNFPGLIFSYALIPDETIRERFLYELKNCDGLSSTSIFGLEATIAAYTNESRWVDELNDYLDATIVFVTEYLKENHPELLTVPSESTYLMWIDCQKLGIPMKELQKAMIDVGKLAIMDGSIYGEKSASFLRLNIGCPREKVKDGLERLTKSIQSLEKI